MAMASHGHPSRKQPSGPLLKHFLHPIHRIGSIAIRPNGGLSSSGTQNMQSSTGQYSTQAGDPAHPVQHSVITANSLGFFFRGVASPFDFGSNLSSSGTIPTALVAPGAGGMRNYNLSQAVLRTRFLGPSTRPGVIPSGAALQAKRGISVSTDPALTDPAQNETAPNFVTAPTISTGPILL